jgi:HEAT repeat protein
MTDDKYGQTKPLDILNVRGLASKRDYVRSLELRGDAEALSLLVECLCDDSWYLRDLAEEAFLKLGDRRAETLLPLLERGVWFTRASAARVLGHLGYRPAVPGLLLLTEDKNDTAASAARDALVAIGSQRGAVRLAHALHRMPPDVRRRRMDEISARDRMLGERVERMMRSEELMSAENADALSDDSAAVRATEEGVEWEVLTGPPPRNESPGDAGEGHA